ncbi:hypothetical protein [Sinanaerobacter sp. ZZT-01]|uniref:hypothetical protein n=1 Tax=Sinanaerobacter sp. ZZT-01 TaxID=3111540 RepID=UPI002D77B3E9|nr:hypothetical protein [Sinanaerobacter sp. ZZT-01]WRR94228.1 hypothetical protein U5921_03665 [Sinanaerobacter sp. ZZT-01]
MGYQESLLFIEPQEYFDLMIKAYKEARGKKYYDIFKAEPKSVITLRRPLMGMLEGTKLLWVCGSRCFHSESGIFGKPIIQNPLQSYVIKIIPVEKMFQYDDEKLNGIVLSDISKSSENLYLKRESIDFYVEKLN